MCILTTTSHPCHHFYIQKQPCALVIRSNLPLKTFVGCTGRALQIAPQRAAEEDCQFCRTGKVNYEFGEREVGVGRTGGFYPCFGVGVGSGVGVGVGIWEGVEVGSRFRGAGFVGAGTMGAGTMINGRLGAHTNGAGLAALECGQELGDCGMGGTLAPSSGNGIFKVDIGEGGRQTTKGVESGMGKEMRRVVEYRFGAGKDDFHGFQDGHESDTTVSDGENDWEEKAEAEAK